MRHRLAHRKLGRTTPHRIALLRNLASALFARERIRTTLMKAKELRPFAERLITLAKREDGQLHARRHALRDIQDQQVVKKLFDTLGARFADRPGGYTRILRLGPRRGDGAEMAIVELLGSEFKLEPKADKAAKSQAGKKKDATGPKAGQSGKPGEKRAPGARSKGKAEAEQAG
jgi:large subunit ribosomal protein L17